MARPRKSVKQNGMQISVGRELTAPDQNKSRVMWSRHPEQGITFSSLNDILIGAEGGEITDFADFAEAMEFKDPQYRTTLSTRKQAAAGLTGVVESASDAPDDIAAAELVRRVISGDFLADHYMNIMDAVGKGFSVCEIIWDYSSDGYLIPIDLKYRPQKFFTFRDEKGEIGDGTQLYFKEDGVSGFNLKPLSDWPHNFLIHFTHGKSGLPVTAGSAYACAYYYLIKQILLKDHLGFAEKYGTPPVIGYYPPGTPGADQDTLFAMLKAMATNSAAIVEQGIEVKPMELNGQRGGGESVYTTLVHYADEAITKVNLGQTLTTDTGGGRGSYALGAVHHAVRIDILKADARQLANTLNRYIVRPMVEFNFGPQSRYPIAKFNVQENIDLTVAQSYLRTAVQLGVPVGVGHVRSLFSLPVPQADEQLLAISGGLAGRPVGSGGIDMTPGISGDQSGEKISGEKAPPVKPDPGSQSGVRGIAKPDGKNSPSEVNKTPLSSLVQDTQLLQAALEIRRQEEGKNAEIAELRQMVGNLSERLTAATAKRKKTVNLIKKDGILLGAEVEEV